MAETHDYTFNPWRFEGKNLIRLSDAGWKKPLAWDRKAPISSGPCCNDISCTYCHGTGFIESGRPRPRVFCASLADVFEEWDGPVLDHRGHRLMTDDRWPGEYACGNADGLRSATLDGLRADLFRLIDQTPNLDWLIETKHPENVRRLLGDRYCSHCEGFGVVSGWSGSLGNNSLEQVADDCPICSKWKDPEQHPNLFLGVPASDQATADAAIPELHKCRDLCAKTFVRLELTGPVDLTQVAMIRRCGGSEGIDALRGVWWDHDPGGYDQPEFTSEEDGPSLDLVIVGGESGPDAKPCNVEWIRSIVRQCAAAGVPCFVKQLGSHLVSDNHSPREWPDQRTTFGMAEDHEPEGPMRVLLADPNGADPSEWPEDLRVRQMPGSEVKHG